MLRAIIGAGLLAGLAACVAAPVARPGPGPVAVVDEPAASDAWRHIASAGDADRIARVAAAWSAGLAELKKANIVSAVREEGVLLDPKAALARPAPTPGSYECRLVKIGAEAKGKPALEKFKPFFCYVEVEGDLFTIVKQTGSERPAGRLWADDEPTRMVFLGSLALGSEDEVKAYGDDPKRDMAGVLERVGPFRWRLVIPWPRDGAKLDVFELTPVANQPS